MPEAVTMTDTQFRETMTDVVMPPYVHCGSPAELMEAYDLLRREQKVHRGGELRRWLEWHWVRSLMVLARRGNTVSGVGLVWRLAEPDQIPADVQFYVPEGPVAFVHYCCVAKRFRDRKGTVMGELVLALRSLHPWVKEIVWESHLDRRRGTKDFRLRRV